MYLLGITNTQDVNSLISFGQCKEKFKILKPNILGKLTIN